MKRKKVFFGWLEDQSHIRDYDTGEIIGKREDESLSCFKFGGSCGRDSDVLGLPLIFPKKKDWKRYMRPSSQIKVTMEFVKRGGKKVESVDVVREKEKRNCFSCKFHLQCSGPGWKIDNKNCISYKPEKERK